MTENDEYERFEKKKSWSFQWSKGTEHMLALLYKYLQLGCDYVF